MLMVTVAFFVKKIQKANFELSERDSHKTEIWRKTMVEACQKAIKTGVEGGRERGTS
jgi:hypothetical protein